MGDWIYLGVHIRNRTILPLYCRCPVKQNCRSRMNVPFRLTAPAGQDQAELEATFIKEAAAAGLKELKGHR